MAKAAAQDTQSTALLAQYVEQQKALDETAVALANALLHEAQIPVGTIVRGDDRYFSGRLFEVESCSLFEVESCSVRRQGNFPDDVGADVWVFGLNSDGSRQGTRYSFPLDSLSPVERASS